MRLLGWLLFGLLIYGALRSKITSRRRQNKYSQTNNRPDNIHEATYTKQKSPGVHSARSTSSTSVPIENMVVCSYCQIYLPASEAIYPITPIITTSPLHYFCCEEHAKLYKNLAK